MLGIQLGPTTETLSLVRNLPRNKVEFVSRREEGTVARLPVSSPSRCLHTCPSDLNSEELCGDLTRPGKNTAPGRQFKRLNLVTAALGGQFFFRLLTVNIVEGGKSGQVREDHRNNPGQDNDFPRLVLYLTSLN